MNIESYFKDKLKVEATTTIIKNLGLKSSDELTESLEERLDAIWSELSIEDSTEIEQAFKFIKEFNLDIINTDDDEFLEKLEIIKVFLEVYGYENIVDIDSSEQEKINKINETLGVELKSITLTDIEKQEKLSLPFVKDLKELSYAETDIFCGFIKQLGIKLNLEDAQIKTASKFNEILESLGYQANSKYWLEEKELKKLKLVLEKLGIDGIDKWTEKTIDSVELIGNNYNNGNSEEL